MEIKEREDRRKKHYNKRSRYKHRKEGFWKKRKVLLKNKLDVNVREEKARVIGNGRIIQIRMHE